MDTLLERLRLTYGALGKAFGLRVKPLGVFAYFMTLRTLVGAGVALDRVVLPGSTSTRIERPIVIVGNPRTGTTFLQRFLHQHGVGTGMQLWRMIFAPAILQKLMPPIIPFLERVSPARHHTTVAHETNLLSVETDDVSILFRHFDGFFLYGFFLAWAEQDWRDQLDPEVRDTSARDFDWLEKLWERNLYATGGDRVLAKLFSLGTRLPAFLERFPDARVLYMVRDPVQVIPSSMSLVTGVLDNAFGFWNRPEEQRRAYLERLYAGLVQILERFHQHWVEGKIPRENVLVVRYDRLMSEFEVVMDEILEHVGLEADEALEAAIAERAEKQRAYRSPHAYDLARFGLDAERIRRDCGFVYETFGIPRG